MSYLMGWKRLDGFVVCCCILLTFALVWQQHTASGALSLMGSLHFIIVVVDA